MTTARSSFPIRAAQARFAKESVIGYVQTTLLAFVALIPVVAASPARAAGSERPASSVQDVLEERGNVILSQRLDPKRYLFYARVQPRTAADGKPSGTIKLPFSPIEIDRKSFEGFFVGGDTGLDLSRYDFALSLLVDESVDEGVAATLEGVLKERFEVDGKTRTLAVRRTKLYVPPKVEPLAVPDGSDEAAVRARGEAQRATLEAEASRARLESERSRLEMSRKEVEYQRNLAALEDSLRTEKVKREDAAHLAGAKPTEKPAPDSLATLVSLQGLAVAVVGLVGLLVVGFVMSGSLRKAMGSVGEGLRAAGGAVGAALSEKKTADEATTEAAPDAAAIAAAEAATTVSAATAAGDWFPGNREHDDFVTLVQEKIDILSRERSLFLRQALADMIDDPTGLPVATAVILALAPDSARVLIQDLPDEQVRKLRALLETPKSVSNAKAIRQAALQEFYGRITAAEFADSPLGRLKNVEWLTRMSTAELVAFTAGLTPEARPVFLACLSPFRLGKMLEKAAGQDKKFLLAGVSGMGVVSEDAMAGFLSERGRDGEFASRAAQAKPAVDHLAYLESVAGTLSPEDQQALLDALPKGGAAHAHMSRRIIPFAAIGACPPELLREIFGKRSAGQTALILFAADPALEGPVLAALGGVKAESARDELVVMRAKPLYEARNRAASLRSQREITAYLLKLANEGLLDLTKVLAAVAKADGAAKPPGGPPAAKVAGAA